MQRTRSRPRWPCCDIRRLARCGTREHLDAHHSTYARGRCSLLIFSFLIMNLQIDHQLALVSASTKGIGFAIARALAREGARVIINGRTAASVEEAAARIREDVPGAKLEKFPGDLSKAADAEKLVAAFPQVDILVNNLGIFDPKPFAEIPDAEWQHFFDVNVLSGVRLSRLYFDGMLKRNRGRIVFISSESALHIPEEMIHYGMT